jgi:acetyl-CoA carboxylase carboxyltransferase component
MAAPATADSAATESPEPGPLAVRGRVPGAASVGLARLAGLVAGARLTDERRQVVLARVDPTQRRGALSEADGATLAQGAAQALELHIPLVAVLSSSGADVHEGVAALHGWGTAARALAACSGVIPTVVVVTGPVVSGPALLLGQADVVVMTADAVAFVSGPAAVAQMTGVTLDLESLGGTGVHARSTGVSALSGLTEEDALRLAVDLLDHLPDHTDSMPPLDRSGTDPADRPTPELRDLLPAEPTGSYDVRDVAIAIADDGHILELRGAWAPQLVTALARIEGHPVGIVANQPRTMAGTLDIAASQKGARFVAFCDAFNLPIITLVDTPGFMPGKDLEWRGMIRHGAQLVFAYARATVPRICLILRKAYGGAYIVMDSKTMGNDLCLAWPSAEVAVMGAQGAVQILHRREDAATQARLVEAYGASYLNPYTAAERGYVDRVIDPAESRTAVAGALRMLATKREHLPARKHDNGPL